ncbi:MAG: hypothetical protein R3A48_20885 [Polyangiales bacterium]
MLCWYSTRNQRGSMTERTTGGAGGDVLGLASTRGALAPQLRLEPLDLLVERGAVEARRGRLRKRVSASIAATWRLLKRPRPPAAPDVEQGNQHRCEIAWASRNALAASEKR